ncbi:uncharacterized protein LOC131844537 [Achroia grisella]|uniref:uncharacterized protein LOC131844537 n=1 Tax=Achroia grisella TaxID=688607 RepID=UPI0027D28A3F|nr:uncharacterized protein LOC131844537 [Achroia grisella]
MEKEHRVNWKCTACYRKTTKSISKSIPTSAQTEQSFTRNNEDASASDLSDQENSNITMRTKNSQQSSDKNNYVTESKIREIIKEEMTGSLQIIIQQNISEQFKKISDQLSHDMNKFVMVLEGIQTRITSVEDRVHVIEKRLDTQKDLTDTVARLQAELNDRDQELLHNDVEINGLPEEKNERPIHLVALVSKKLGLEVNENDIVNAERVGTRQENKNEVDPYGDEKLKRPRTLVVRLLRRSLRDELLRAARVRRGLDCSGLNLQTDSNRLYINERLTRDNKQLFYKVREACRIFKWRFSWTRHGKIFTRREPGESVHRIRSIAEINKVFGEYPVGPK